MTAGLTVIIPIYNEADILAVNTLRLRDYLLSLGQAFEIILVSNGSTDDTVETGSRLAQAYPEVHTLALPEKGVGRAFALGAGRARYDYIVSVDMDLSIDLDLIPRAGELLKEYQIVVGSKKLGSQKRPFWRKAGSTAYILTARLLLGLSFEDYSMAAKAYRREVVSRYIERLDDGTSYVLDLIYLTLRDGGRVMEVPVYCEDYRVSKFNLIQEAVERFSHLFRLWRRYRRGWS